MESEKYRMRFTKKSGVDVKASELGKILSKEPNRATPEEKTVLLDLYFSKGARGGVAREQLEKILLKRIDLLTPRERTVLEGFYGALTVARFLLEEKERKRAAA